MKMTLDYQHPEVTVPFFMETAIKTVRNGPGGTAVGSEQRCSLFSKFT